MMNMFATRSTAAPKAALTGALLLASSFIGVSAANAMPTYGMAVDGPESNTLVATGNQSNTTDPSLVNQIDFFIPLADGHHGVFGVDGVGMSSGVFQAGGSGSMDMWLRFAPERTGDSILTLDFTDLDLFSVNDPDGFLESLEILGRDGASMAFIDAMDHEAVVFADFDTQLIELALTITEDPFFLRLTLGASLENKSGKYRNTVESLTASVDYIPAPATLALFGFGLIGLGAAARRRRASSC